jgi:hypothetical protein
VVGRQVQLNKHPFTIVGVAPAEFHGTLLFFSPDFFMPIVNQEQVSGVSVLNARGNRTGVFVAMGHLKTGVTPAQAIADLDSIGSYLGKNYPKDDAKMSFSLARPGLAGDIFGGPVKGFVTGLMLLAGLILAAACANLGSLFAARAADRTREIALRLALGSSRNRILRTLFTEAILISIVGGAIGLWGSVMLLGRLSVWQPFPRFPIKCLCCSFGFGVSQRNTLRPGSGAPGAQGGSLPGGQVGINRRGGTADYHPRLVAGGANCDLCRAGDFFHGCGAWTRALTRQQFRF